MGRRSPTGLHLAFAGLGTTGAAIPAALPTLAEIANVPTTALLPAVPLLFTGLFAGVLVAPRIADALGSWRAVAVAALLQAVALLVLAAAGTTGVVLGAAAAAGAGFGVAESGATAAVRQLRTTASGTLAGLTAATAATATCVPLAVAVARPAHLGLVLAAAALPHLVAAAVLGTLRDSATSRRAPRPTHRIPHPTRGVAVALFCYVGAETLLSGYSAALPQASFGLSSERAALGTAAFWALLMIGRLTAAAAIRRGAAPRTVLAVCQLGAAASAAAGAVTAGCFPDARALFALLVGICVTLMGPCYALLVGHGIDTVPRSSVGTTTATLVAAGAVGGVAWTVVVIGAHPHAPATTVILAACIAMTVSSVAALRCATPRPPGLN